MKTKKRENESVMEECAKRGDSLASRKNKEREKKAQGKLYSKRRERKIKGELEELTKKNGMKRKTY